MTNEEVRNEFQEVSKSLFEISEKLKELQPSLAGELVLIDIQALNTILTDLAWASENCHIIGCHQVGEALQEFMGLK